jgi:L-histidine N-alpha-methyltransferase
VTARFNLNMLRVLNRELGADFDLDRFRHRATWNDRAARIEMQLVSLERQTVHVAELGMDVELDAGEAIRTELSHKYTRETAEAVLKASGLRLERWSTDDDARFALGLAGVDA